MPSRIMLVSSDGHIGAPLPVYRDYIAPKHRSRYDEWLVAHRSVEVALRDKGGFDQVAMPGRRPPFLSEQPESGITAAEVCDPAVRSALLEAEGAVAEVLFPGPDFASEMGYPFGASEEQLSTGTSVALFNSAARGDLELGAVGECAYNRWLADYCKELRGRAVGLMHPPRHDMDDAVRQIEWGANAGLGGIQLPSDDPRLPPYWDRYWDPLWSACEDVAWPVHFHAGTSHGMEKGVPSGNSTIAKQILGAERTFWMGRPLKLLIFGRVLERHEALKVVFTELSCDWVPGMLARMDWQFADSFLVKQYEIDLPRPPSEYWYRQCYVGASLLSRDEVLMRDHIGVDNMMYGIDFPHPEGSWLRTTEWLEQIFGGTDISETDLRKILGQNAVKVYGLSTEKLQPIAERVGPSYDDLALAEPRPRSEWGEKFSYMALPYRPALSSPSI